MEEEVRNVRHYAELDTGTGVVDLWAAKPGV